MVLHFLGPCLGGGGGWRGGGGTGRKVYISGSGERRRCAAAAAGAPEGGAGGEQNRMHAPPWPPPAPCTRLHNKTLPVWDGGSPSTPPRPPQRRYPARSVCITSTHTVAGRAARGRILGGQLTPRARADGCSPSPPSRKDIQETVGWARRFPPLICFVIRRRFPCRGRRA